MFFALTLAQAPTQSPSHSPSTEEAQTAHSSPQRDAISAPLAPIQKLLPPFRWPEVARLRLNLLDGTDTDSTPVMNVVAISVVTAGNVDSTPTSASLDDRAPSCRDDETARSALAAGESPKYQWQ